MSESVTEQLPPLEWCECHHLSSKHYFVVLHGDIETVETTSNCHTRQCRCLDFQPSDWRPWWLQRCLQTKIRDINYERGHIRSLRGFLWRRRLERLLDRHEMY